MSFFIRQKRKKGKPKFQPAKKTLENSVRPDKTPIKKLKYDENIESDTDEEEGDLNTVEYESSSEDEQQKKETSQDKRIRLAKQYIEQIKKEETEKEEDRELDHDLISARLRQDVLEQTHRLHYEKANLLDVTSPELVKVLRGHKLSVTCLVLSTDVKYIYTGSKDSSVIKWEVESGKKIQTIPGYKKSTVKSNKGHTGHILAIALSTDNKYLVTGDSNNIIHIWNPSDLSYIKTFRGHRGPITGLVFRKQTHQLFSCSGDRSVKIWNLDEMSYVETLFGHQDSISNIDSLNRDRAITCGSRDASIRIWKIIEESQLVFNCRKGSVDCVALINESSFITGHDNNSLCLWHVSKKKPVYTRWGAHGEKMEGDKIVMEENWITSVAALTYSDVAASAGCKDGFIRLWKIGPELKYLHPLFTIPMKGFVNSLKFSDEGNYLVAGVGQEHRLGRWWRLKEAKNSVCIIPLATKSLDMVTKEVLEEET